MSYKDEEFITIKKSLEEYNDERYSEESIDKEIEEQSIYENNITIYDIPVKFSEYLLLNKKISILMPADFNLVDKEIIDKMYPLGSPPNEVYSNSYIDLNIGFSETGHIIINESIKEFSQIVRSMLEKTGPNVKIYGENFIKSAEDNIAILEFVSHTFDNILYNLMFFCSIDDKALIGFINFKIENIKRIKPIAREIIASIKILKEEN